SRAFAPRRRAVATSAATSSVPASGMATRRIMSPRKRSRAPDPVSDSGSLFLVGLEANDLVLELADPLLQRGDLPARGVERGRGVVLREHLLTLAVTLALGAALGG